MKSIPAHLQCIIWFFLKKTLFYLSKNKETADIIEISAAFI